MNNNGGGNCLTNNGAGIFQIIMAGEIVLVVVKAEQGISHSLIIMQQMMQMVMAIAAHVFWYVIW